MDFLWLAFPSTISIFLMRCMLTQFSCQLCMLSPRFLKGECMIFRESPWGKTRHLVKAWSMEGKKKQTKKQTNNNTQPEHRWVWPASKLSAPLIPHVRKSGFQNPEIFACGFRNPGTFCLWNSDAWALEFGIQLEESGIPLTIVIQKPSSTGKDWNPVLGNRNLLLRIQNPQRPCGILKGKSGVRWGRGGGGEGGSWLVFEAVPL